MSSYIANIHCEKCGKLLTSIRAFHEPSSAWFVPQDIVEKDFRIDSQFCQGCLNGRGENDGKEKGS